MHTQTETYIYMHVCQCLCDYLHVHVSLLDGLDGWSHMDQTITTITGVNGAILASPYK